MSVSSSIPIFDGHNDSIQTTYLEKRGQGVTIIQESPNGHIDLIRAKKGNMIGGFYAIQVPPEKEEEKSETFGFHINKDGYYIDIPSPINSEYAYNFTSNILAYVQQLITQNPTKLKLIKKSKDISLNSDAPHGMLLHLEGAEAVRKDLSNLETLYFQGVRSIGLFWSRPNVFGTGVQYVFPSNNDIGKGLTEEGKKLVQTCNEIGIIVDLAHINLKGFWDVARISSKPLVITHTSVHKICNTSRAINDEQIDAVAKSGGVIGILFEPMMINPSGLSIKKGQKLDQVFRELKKTSLSLIVEHIKYIVDRVGIDYVALGSDMDGAIMPNALGDASQFQNIVSEMEKSGFKRSEIEKVCHKNWIRVISETIG